MGTSGTERGCSWLFVPFLCNKTCWVHAESWASPANSVRTVYFAHATTPVDCCAQIGVHAHLRWCLPTSTSNEMVRVLDRSGRSVPPKKKKGAAFIPLIRYFVFLGLHVCYNQSTPMHVANNTPFGCSDALWGGLKTRPRFALGVIQFGELVQLDVACSIKPKQATQT